MSSAGPNGPPRARLRRVSRRYVQSSRDWWRASLPVTASRRVRELDLDTHALALCAQQVLCTAPLIVAMSAVLQRETGKGVGQVTARFFGLRDTAADAVSSLLGRASSGSISTGALVFSMITAVVFSTSVAAVQQRAFELIWSQTRVSGVRSYLRQLVWAVGLGVFCLAMLFAGRLGHLLNSYLVSSAGFVSGLALQTILIFAFYLWSQRWLLQGRVPRGDLVPGALAIALGTAVMFRVSRLIVPRQIVWQSHAYGPIGVVFVLSAWLMVLCMVIFGGALFGGLLHERRAGATPVGDPLVVVDDEGHVIAEIDERPTLTGTGPLVGRAPEEPDVPATAARVAG